jgi:hypothetical protein
MNFILIPSESQSCSKALRQLFKGEQLFYFDEIYRMAIESGLKNEWFFREEGVSFNPRPARLLQLGVEATLVSTAELQQVIQDAISFDAFDKNFSYSATTTPTILDWLRHYHLVKARPHPSRTPEQITAHHEQIMSLYKNVVEEKKLPPFFYQKLISAFHRYQ